jgi:protein ImuB
MYGGLHSPRSLPREDALLVLARDFTPRVEARGSTPVLLDLQGLGRAWPTPHELGRALLEAAASRSLETQVALAYSRTVVLVLARAKPGVTVVPAGKEASVLAPLPLNLLGLDLEREELLLRWGLRTIGDLQRLPPDGLAARFGPEGPRLRHLARGEDEGILVPTAVPESFEMTLELDWPVDGLEPLAFLLARVLEPLCAHLTRRGRRATTLVLDLGLVDGTSHVRALRPAAPSGEPRTWRTLILLDLEAHPPHDAIQRITARAEPTPAREVQFSLLDPALPSPERLAETMARLTTWTAGGRGGEARLLDTHRPGAFAIGTFAPGPATPASEAPPPPRVALRVYRPPRRAHVVLEGGAPAFVGASGVRGRVVAWAGPWRGSGDWWDVAWSREEWDVALAGGGVFRLFFDRLREAWFVEGELD